MKLHIRRSLLALAVLTSFTFVACNNGAGEPVNQNKNLNEYYNEKNFLSSENEVTTTKLVTYDGPSALHSYEGVNVEANEIPLFVYETRVNYNRKFSWDVPSTTVPVVIFDFEGRVHIEITIDEVTINSATVSPKIYGITPEVEENKISFDLEYNGNYVVEYNDDYKTAIHIFASEIEKNSITEEQAEKDDSIIYIGPGVYKADAIPVDSNKTIYLAGGAFVYGQIRTEDLENVTIRGRGIISGAIYNRRSESEYTIPVEIRTTDTVLIEGITFLDPAGWTIALYKSKNIKLENVKIISARQNGDGISVQSCENVEVNGGFVRTWDDSLVVKNSDRGNTKNVKFDGVVVWTDLAQSMEVGYETYGATMDEITFENITVLHNFHKAAISIHNSDDADITNVTYKNITIEDAQMLGDNQTDAENDFFIDFTIAYSIDWTKSEGDRGTINGVSIENVKIYKIADTIVSRMSGESTASKIQNVTIKGIEIAGKTVNDLAELKILSNSYVDTVSYSKAEVLGAYIKLPYKLNLKDNNVDSKKNTNITQEGMYVPDFAIMSGDLAYIGVPSLGSFTAKATHGSGNKTTTPADDGSGDFTLTNSSASNTVDGNKSTTWKSAAWKMEENEFVALTIEFDSVKTIGVIRILGNQDNKFYYNYNIQVWGRRLKTDGTVNENYTRLSATKEYEMSPGSGNAIDVNITTQGYIGLQLRLYRSDSETAAPYYEISELQFFPPSLVFGKSIVYSSEHNDVYNVEKLIDGDATGTSYYESKGFPAEIVIDLGDLYDVNTFVLSLPPSLLWSTRTQEIEILGSATNNSYNSNIEFSTIVEKSKYLFDPTTGNRNIVTTDTIKVRYIKLVITSNDVKGGYSAQLSEFSVYGA
ncbi:MAG: discoidin domain-containing protein [Anaeroplasma bactoclasticum]|nr:discoidin domain-containing protein [Anaeroplasma bactoclasticum]